MISSSQNKPDTQDALETLLRQNTQLWRGRSQIDNTRPQPNFASTGFTPLDAALPGGGWPLDSVIEIIVDEWGQGELSILLPLMTHISQRQKTIVFISPPYMPYAPAIQAKGIDLEHLWIVDSHKQHGDAIWAAEKALASVQGALVLMWLKPSTKQIRRLQIAAHTGGALGVLIHNKKVTQSPVSLRLGVSYKNDSLKVNILKARQVVGNRQSKSLILPL